MFDYAKMMIPSIMFFAFIGIGCANKNNTESEHAVSCNTYKNYASASFEVEGDMVEIVEKTAKKALMKSCFKKAENSTSNLRIKIQSNQTLHTESGFIKDKHNNTLSLDIAIIMLMPTNKGGLTTLTSKQNARLNLKSEPIANLGNKAELSDKEVIPFVETNVLTALTNLFNDMP